eukprot:CAMPEP_0170184842 /NCGR_PEP_ID=MMETSP0040_2-20121228/34811_1 /TAXON_ID=641309 /ORGANISM="Lotharella oceanica, Strain CCMP622" /LENGTH=225 /DNA_ID=CAMNT_0010431031 /DNA_START=74 /DNA_END=751 /DNA_ORIENTATION=-
MTMGDFVAGLKKPHIVALCGSQRKGSFNKLLLDSAVKHLNANGATCEFVDLADLKLPMYNPDDEAASFPEAAKEFKKKLVACDGLMITCPEYNGLMTPLLLNALTWATRGEGGMYDAFKGTCATVMATSPGKMGGLRMVRSLQGFLQDMGCVVIPTHCAFGGAFKLFNKDGSIKDVRANSSVQTACSQLIHHARFEANRDYNCKIVKAIKGQKVMGEYGAVFDVL